VPSYFHLLSDGRVVDQSVCDDSAVERCGRVDLVRQDGTGRVRLHDDSAPGTPFAHYFESDDSHLVWSAAPDQALFFTDWEIWAVATTGNSKALRIAQAPREPDGKPLAGGIVWPRVSGGVVVWVALTRATPGASPTPNVLAADVTGDGPMRVLATNAIGAAIAWPYVFYNPLDSNGQPQKPERLDLRDGSKSVLGGFKEPCEVIAGWGTIICTDRSRDLYVADLDGVIRVHVKPSTTRRLAWIEVGESAVVWSDENGAVILTLDDLKIRYASVVPYAVSAGTSGSWIWWNDLPNPDEPPSTSNTERYALNLG
jgi:hypothetical protein